MEQPASVRWRQVDAAVAPRSPEGVVPIRRVQRVPVMEVLNVRYVAQVELVAYLVAAHGGGDVLRVDQERSLDGSVRFSRISQSSDTGRDKCHVDGPLSLVSHQRLIEDTDLDPAALAFGPARHRSHGIDADQMLVQYPVAAHRFEIAARGQSDFLSGDGDGFAIPERALDLQASAARITTVQVGSLAPNAYHRQLRFRRQREPVKAASLHRLDAIEWHDAQIGGETPAAPFMFEEVQEREARFR